MRKLTSDERKTLIDKLVGYMVNTLSDAPSELDYMLRYGREGFDTNTDQQLLATHVAFFDEDFLEDEEAQEEFVCRHCGGDSSDIVGADTAMVKAGIARFVRDDEGKITPEWSGSSEVLWETQSAEHRNKPYYCDNCDVYLSEEDVVSRKEYLSA